MKKKCNFCLHPFFDTTHMNKQGFGNNSNSNKKKKMSTFTSSHAQEHGMERNQTRERELDQRLGGGASTAFEPSRKTAYIMYVTCIIVTILCCIVIVTMVWIDSITLLVRQASITAVSIIIIFIQFLPLLA